MARILLLESDRLLAQNLIKALKRRGHQPSWQVDAQQALDAADEWRPDLVILDLFLAQRGGVEFLYEYRSYPEWQSIPVIIFSHVAASELGHTADQLKSLNISSYFHKPVVNLNDLCLAIDRLLATTAAK